MAGLPPARRTLKSCTALLLLALPPLATGTTNASATPPVDDLEGVRLLYLEAVQDRAAIDRGMEAIAALRDGGGSVVGDRAAALKAYEGALTTLRAKHGSWPPRRLAHLRDGLALLDSVVAEHPRHAEARYLRLMSCYYLPSFLGRSASVREDFAALARLLPAVRADYPAELYRAIAEFVLENGSPDEQERAALMRSMRDVDA